MSIWFAKLSNYLLAVVIGNWTAKILRSFTKGIWYNCKYCIMDLLWNCLNSFCIFIRHEELYRMIFIYRYFQHTCSYYPSYRFPSILLVNWPGNYFDCQMAMVQGKCREMESIWFSPMTNASLQSEKSQETTQRRKKNWLQNDCGLT